MAYIAALPDDNIYCCADLFERSKQARICFIIVIRSRRIIPMDHLKGAVNLPMERMCGIIWIRSLMMFPC